VKGTHNACWVLVVLAGWSCVGGCSTLPSHAAERIKKADRAYRVRRYTVAEELLAPVIEAHSRTPDAAEAFYIRALCRLKAGRLVEAEGDLEQAKCLTRRNGLLDRVHAQLGNIEFDKGRYHRAVVYYEAAYDDLPNRPPKDRIGYQYGVSLQRVGHAAEARSVFGDVVTKYPRSPVAAQARRKAAWQHDSFFIQCGAYRKIAGAHQHASSLKNQGVDAIAVPEKGVSSRLYMVRVGPYRTYAAARGALPDVQRVQPDAFIIP